MTSTGWDKNGSEYLHFFNSPVDAGRRGLIDPVILELCRPQGKHILDLGCGEGYLSRLLKKHKAREATGIDVSADLIAKAKSLDPEGDYRLLDIVREDFHFNQLDAVIANMVLHNLPDLADVFRKISATLKPRGMLIASILNPYYAYPVGTWKRQIRSILSGDFKPHLQIKNYFLARKQSKVLSGTRTEFEHYHHQMADYINEAVKHGLILKTMIEPKTNQMPLYLILQYERV